MSIYISVRRRQTFHDSVFFDFFGEMGKKVHDFELQKMVEPDPDKDPEKPPPIEHGDKYLFIGTFIGSILGGIIGGLLSLVVGWFVFNVIAGLFLGAVAGVLVGSLVKKHVVNKESMGKYTDKQNYIRNK